MSNCSLFLSGSVGSAALVVALVLAALAVGLVLLVVVLRIVLLVVVLGIVLLVVALVLVVLIVLVAHTVHLLAWLAEIVCSDGGDLYKKYLPHFGGRYFDDLRLYVK